MMTYIRRSIIVLAVAVLAACGADRSTATRKYAVLSDGRSDGAAGFYFLPPVAPDPGTDTVNDRGLSPVVEITALEPGAVPIARFEGEAVRASGSHYMVHWSTKIFVPVYGTTYRIRVLLDGKELGFADAAVAKNGTELHLLGSDDVFGLMGQRTVPIKFRIHVQPADPCEGVVCAEPTQCQASLVCDPALQPAACVATAQPAGVTCDDANPCTAGDACDGEGACVAGPPVVCPGDDACNDPACDPALGCVNHPLPNGTNCLASTGFPGYCQLNTTTGVSACIEVPPGKLTR
jgi:hypothetical protein